MKHWVGKSPWGNSVLGLGLGNEGQVLGLGFWNVSLLTSLHITPLLRQLRWLKARERTDFKLALLVHTSQHGAAPSYLANELRQPADFEAQRRLRSASSSSLIVRLTRLSTIGDQAFPVAAACVWNSLPQHVTSASSLSVFRSRLNTHLVRRRYPWFHPPYCCAWELDTVIVGHINRCYLLSHNCSFMFSYVMLKEIEFGRVFSPLPRKFCSFLVWKWRILVHFRCKMLLGLRCSLTNLKTFSKI